MLINLTDVFTSEGKDRQESLVFEADSISYLGSSYNILEKSPVGMSFSNTGNGRLMMRGSMDLTLEIPCDRCLVQVKVPLHMEFEQELYSPDAAGNIEDQDQQNFVEGYELDVEAFMKSEILINMPVKVLCCPDCKGICRQCGQNLNEGSCECDTFVPDPRMAAIKDIFNGNKEV